MSKFTTPSLDYWSDDLVMDYLRQAAAIHRRLPPVSVPGYQTLWPEPLKDDWHRLYDLLNGKTLLGPPMPPEVTFHEETMEWLRLVDRRNRQILWMRANRIPWKIVVNELGRSKPTLWREMKAGLSLIATHLQECDPKGEHYRVLRLRAFA